MAEKNGKEGRGPRCVALVGPQGSGKTTLLESILWITGAITRKGSQSQHNTVGDASPEARDRLMSVELAAATTNYLGEHFSFVDCPGSIEFLQESLNAIIGVDAVVVVAEPDPAKAQMLQPMLKRLSDLAIPHFLFINKVDKAQGSMRDLLVALQPAAPKPLVLRQPHQGARHRPLAQAGRRRGDHGDPPAAGVDASGLRLRVNPGMT